MIASSKAPKPELRGYQYSNAKESSVEIDPLLASLARTMDPNELSHLRDRLKGVAQLPLDREDPLGDYLNVLSDVSNNMLEIEARLRDARASFSSGNTGQAVRDLRKLKELRDSTRPRIESLPGLLDRLTVYYQIDTTTHRKKLAELDTQFQADSDQIDKLEAELEIQQGFIQTTLSLHSSRQEVFVEETFTVYGFLKDQNGSAMMGRNITISWNTNSTTATTSFDGRFEANIFFPIGFPAGSTVIKASFEPGPSDSKIYLSSTSQLEIRVAYYTSVLKADIYPKNARPLAPMDVSGHLLSSEGMPLKLRVLLMQLDGSFLGNATTNIDGSFMFSFSVPQDVSNGTHIVTVTYPATNDRFAPSNVTLPFLVELLGSQLQIRLDRTSLFSGTKLVIDGTATLTNGTASKYGNVTIDVDNIQYSSTIVKDDGSFSSTIQLPMGLAFGSHSVRVTYNSDRPGVEGSEATTTIFVYNTPVIVSAILGIAVTSSVGVYLFRRKRRTASLEAPVPIEPMVMEKSLSKDEFLPETLISTIDKESDNSAKVKRSYRLAQAMINQKLNETPRESETHWEYFSRVIKTIPNVRDSLKHLVELFELAEYSPYPIENVESTEAVETLLKLRKDCEAVK